MGENRILGATWPVAVTMPIGEKYNVMSGEVGPMSALPNLGIDAVDQIGLVVRDLEDGMDRFGALFGAGPWKVYEFEPPALTNQTYHGEPADYSMRLAIVGRDQPGAEIELIEPGAGPNIYADHLEAQGEGLHHVGCFGLSDPAAAVEELQSVGIETLQTGTFEGTDFWYMDTREILNGVIVETTGNGGGGATHDDVYEPSGFPGRL